MGYCKQRVNRQGHARYTAYYWDLRGRARSAGTFSRKREARARLPRPWARTRSGPCPPEPVTGRVVEHRVPILQFTAGVFDEDAPATLHLRQGTRGVDCQKESSEFPLVTRGFTSHRRSAALVPPRSDETRRVTARSRRQEIAHSILANVEDGHLAAPCTRLAS